MNCRNDEMSKVHRWLRDYSKDHVLLIEGPTGIGKATFIRAFIDNVRYLSLQTKYIDVKKEKETFNKILKDNYLTVDNFYSSLFFYLHQEEMRSGGFLIFENIEYCPLLRQFTKTLCEDGRYKIIATTCGGRGNIHYGLKLVPSNEHVIKLLPLSFGDFLVACKKGNLANRLQVSLKKREPIAKYLSEEFNQQYYRYLIVGGYPSVVEKYASTHDLYEAMENNSKILNKQFDHLKDFIGNKSTDILEEIKTNIHKVMHSQSISFLGKNKMYYAKKVLELMVEENIINKVDAYDFSEDKKRCGKSLYYFGNPAFYSSLNKSTQIVSNSLFDDADKKAVMADFFSSQKKKEEKLEYGLVRKNMSYFKCDGIMKGFEHNHFIWVKMKNLAKQSIKNFSVLSDNKLGKSLILYNDNIYEYKDIIVLPLYCAGSINDIVLDDDFPF